MRRQLYLLLQAGWGVFLDGSGTEINEHGLGLFALVIARSFGRSDWLLGVV